MNSASIRRRDGVGVRMTSLNVSVFYLFTCGSNQTLKAETVAACDRSRHFHHAEVFPGPHTHITTNLLY